MDPIKGELIGKKVDVLSSKNKSLIGISGKVLDETKSMLLLDAKKRKLWLIKRECVFAFEINGQKTEIDGKEIEKRAEDRIAIKKNQEK
jgi:ribonuclease P protein subunit POP4